MQRDHARDIPLHQVFPDLQISQIPEVDREAYTIHARALSITQRNAMLVVSFQMITMSQVLSSIFSQFNQKPLDRRG